jgi:hypothetical protein
MKKWSLKINRLINKIIPGMRDVEETSIINRSYKRTIDDQITYTVASIENEYAKFESGEMVRVDLLHKKFIDVTPELINESVKNKKNKDMSIIVQESEAAQSTIIAENGRQLPESVVRQQEYEREQARLKDEEAAFLKKQQQQQPLKPVVEPDWDDDDIDINQVAAVPTPTPQAHLTQPAPVQQIRSAPVKAQVQAVPQQPAEVAVFQRTKRLNDLDLKFDYTIKVPADDQLKLLDNLFELSYLDYLADDLVAEIMSDPTAFKDKLKEQLTNHFYGKKPARKRAPAKRKTKPAPRSRSKAAPKSE